MIERKNRAIWGKWFFAFALLALFAVVSRVDFSVLNFLESKSAALSAEDGHKDVTGAVDLTVGSIKFRVPINYLFNRNAKFLFNRDMSKRESDGFSIHVLLPGLEPYSDENASEFEKLGHQRKLHLLVQTMDANPPAPIKLSNTLRNSQYSLVESADTGPPGLVLYKSKLQNQKELFVPKTSGAVPVFFSCTKLGSRQSPSCRGVTDFEGRLSLSYVFSREYIRDWREIDASIKKLLKTFTVVDHFAMK